MIVIILSFFVFFSAYSMEKALQKDPLREAVEAGNVTFFTEAPIELFARKYEGGMRISHIAAREGKTGILKKIVERDPSLANCKTDRGQTPFHVAASLKFAEVCVFLNEQNPANIEDCTFYSKNVFFYGAVTGDVEFFKKLLSLFRESYRKRVARMVTDEELKREVANRLARAVMPEGLLSVHEVARRGLLPMLRYLLILNEDLLEMRDKKGYTILHYGALSGKTEIVDYIVGKNKELTTVVSQAEESAAYMAALHGKREAVMRLVEIDRSLLERLTTLKRTLFHAAVMSGNVDLAEQLLAEKSGFLLMHGWGNSTAAHMAAASRRLPMLKVLLEKHPGFVDEVTDQGVTILLDSIKPGNTEMTKYLLDHTDLKDKPDASGFGCLHYAVLTDEKEMILLCLTRCPDQLFLSNDQGDIPYELAIAENKEIARALLRKQSLAQVPVSSKKRRQSVEKQESGGKK